MGNRFVFFAESQLVMKGSVVFDITQLLLFIVSRKKLIVIRYCKVQNIAVTLHQRKGERKTLEDFKNF